MRFKYNGIFIDKEFESFVLDAPFFKQRLEIKRSSVKKDSASSKVLIIEELKMKKKE